MEKEVYEKIERVGRYIYSSGVFLSVVAYVFFIDFSLHISDISSNPNMFLFTMGIVIALTILIGVASFRPGNLVNYLRIWAAILFLLFIVHLLTFHPGEWEFTHKEIIWRYRFIYASEVFGTALLLAFSFIRSRGGMVLGFSLLLLPWAIYYPKIIETYRYIWSAVSYAFPIPGTYSVGPAMFPLYLLIGVTTGTSALLLALGAIYSAVLPEEGSRQSIFFGVASALLAVQFAFIISTLKNSVYWLRELVSGSKLIGNLNQLSSLGLTTCRIALIAAIIMFLGAVIAGIGNFNLIDRKES